MEYIAQVNKDGKLPKQLVSDMQAEFVSFAGKKIRVIIEKFVKKRSLLQNGWYWGCAIKLMSEHSGYFPYEVHELLASHLLGTHPVKIGSVTKDIPNSTKDLTTTDFMAYKEQIQAFASTEMNVIVPDPDPNWKGDFVYLEDELGIKE